MKIFLEKYLPLREGAGGGSGGGAGVGEGGGAGAAGGWTAPAGLPDAYRGTTAEETVSKLLGGYTEANTRFEGLRSKLAGMPKAPDTPDLYTYDPSDRLKPYFAGDLSKDPVFSQARQAFHKHGISQDAFSGVIEDLYGPLVEKGLIAAPLNPKAEVDTFAAELGLDRDGASRALTDAYAFAQGLSSQLVKNVPEKLKADVEAQLIGLTDTAAGNVLLQALAGRLAESGIRIAGTGQQAGQLTEADLKKLDADPRIDPANRNHPDVNRRFDEDLRKRYDQAYQRLAPANKTSW